jgi:hypothetical protein
MEDVPRWLVAMLAGMLVVAGTSGFILPPFWHLDEWPSCSITEGNVTSKGKNTRWGFYDEYYVILDNKSTIWMSPASSMVIQVGDEFKRPVCN